MKADLCYALTMIIVLFIFNQCFVVVEARHSMREKEVKEVHSFKSKSKHSREKEEVVQQVNPAKKEEKKSTYTSESLKRAKEEARDEAIAELKVQPKLVAMIDGFNLEETTPLYSNFPTPSPGSEGASAMPTVLEDCDPASPPCKKFTNGGLCAIYYNCEHYRKEKLVAQQRERNHRMRTGFFGEETDDGNENDEFSPTKMPVPSPTPAPSNPPTSVPTSSAPTYHGYTPMPTVSMAPTVEETSGPTSKGLCNPEKPPCDHWFNGTCLGTFEFSREMTVSQAKLSFLLFIDLISSGVVHCRGSHSPTYAPTHSPGGTDPPTARPSGPTEKPTIGPTDFGLELDQVCGSGYP